MLSTLAVFKTSQDSKNNAATTINVPERFTQFQSHLNHPSQMFAARIATQIDAMPRCFRHSLGPNALIEV